MEGADDLYKSRWASKLAEYRPECSSVHCVECLGEIDEEQVEVLVLLDTFFLELPDSKDPLFNFYLFCLLKMEAPRVPKATQPCESGIGFWPTTPRT